VDLNEILAELYLCKDPGVVVGPGDDAGVFRHKNTLMVETVDVITPIVDDPYTFGAICAANSVSDIYAMGGTPLTALAILGYASCDFGPVVIKELLKGAVDKLREAGVCLIGGHSIEDSEFKFGFAISGIVKSSEILRLKGARPGSVLILTKRLGTGVLTSAVKLKRMRPSRLGPAIQSMLGLNRVASMIARRSGANAATDVTGFGLLGHALNMARASGVDLVINYRDVPFMEAVRYYIKKGIVPKGARRTLEFCIKDVAFPEGFREADMLALADPQTSGGMLISLPERRLGVFKRLADGEGMAYWVIGVVTRGKGRVIIR
jgi:selenide,water dikinase